MLPWLPDQLECEYSTGIALRVIDHRSEFPKSCKQLRNFFLLFNLECSKEKLLKK